ncbi:putative alcohol dehydrogenase protein [Neofusicoccum parvum UCRNP2]|uniref:Putative alcohol dehydrogenase protein n=1 Tax=Botryosphaeria parva (strain UCR-NP2) TaxID=1287680 RepID=R1EZ02_BOTPV|nr:putative alcohol dehydrogenase protein [Neofusicoccum parvum UCRNP2]
MIPEGQRDDWPHTGPDPIPDSMLACQVVEFKKPYKIHQIPVPAGPLGATDLLVKVAVASLCHTDNMVAAGTFAPPLPCTASHEGAGTVAATGGDVHDLRPGDRVMCGLYLHQCGACGDCAAGAPQYCAHSAGAIGVHTHGAFAEYVRVDARNAVKLPDNPDEVSVPFRELVFRDIKIHGSLICGPEEARQMMKVVSENGISVKTNPVHGLNEIPKLLELARSGKMSGKGIVIVDPKQIEHEKTIGATI